MNKILILVLIVLLFVYVAFCMTDNLTSKVGEKLEGFADFLKGSKIYDPIRGDIHPKLDPIDPTNPSIGLDHPINERDALVSHNSNASHRPVGHLDAATRLRPYPKPDPNYQTKTAREQILATRAAQHMSKPNPQAVQNQADGDNAGHNMLIMPGRSYTLETNAVTVPATRLVMRDPMNPQKQVSQTDALDAIKETRQGKSLTFYKEGDNVSDVPTSKNVGPLPPQISDAYNMQNMQGMHESFDDSSVDSEMCDMAEKCSKDSCGSESLHPILDPRFNMREVAKQALLLEDHMNNTKKRCFDCIRKHFLIIDGLLEEAVSLEKDIRTRGKYRDLYLKWVALEKQYSSDPLNSDNIDSVSQKIRFFRKPLVESYFDLVKEYDLEDLVQVGLAK